MLHQTLFTTSKKKKVTHAILEMDPKGSQRGEPRKASATFRLWNSVEVGSSRRGLPRATTRV